MRSTPTVGDLGSSSDKKVSGVLSTMIGVRAMLSVGDRGSNGSCRFGMHGSLGGVVSWYGGSSVLGLSASLCCDAPMVLK